MENNSHNIFFHKPYIKIYPADIVRKMEKGSYTIFPKKGVRKEECI